MYFCSNTVFNETNDVLRHDKAANLTPDGANMQNHVEIWIALFGRYYLGQISYNSTNP
jgi:hypothetical protein